MVKEVIIICKNCLKEFEVSYKQRKRKFCTLSCSSIYNNEHRDYSWFEGDKNPSKRESVRKKISRKLKGRTNTWMIGKRNPNHKSNGGIKLSVRKKLSDKAKIRLRDKCNHPNWRGGITLADRGDDWTEELRTKIRKRDRFVCFICKRNGFVVHHINYIKKDNNPDNLITLCRSCHVKTNYNREKWMRFFNDRVI